MGEGCAKKPLVFNFLRSSRLCGKQFIMNQAVNDMATRFEPLN
jgi:hypothetical protein